MTDEQYVKLLQVIPAIHAEIDAVVNTGHNPGAAHVMLINMYTELCAAAEELPVKSPALEDLVAQRIRIASPSQTIVDQINNE